MPRKTPTVQRKRGVYVKLPPKGLSLMTVWRRCTVSYAGGQKVPHCNLLLYHVEAKQELASVEMASMARGRTIHL